jgi:hypothetical protein
MDRQAGTTMNKKPGKERLGLPAAYLTSPSLVNGLPELELVEVRAEPISAIWPMAVEILTYLG